MSIFNPDFWTPDACIGAVVFIAIAGVFLRSMWSD